MRLPRTNQSRIPSTPIDSLHSPMRKLAKTCLYLVLWEVGKRPLWPSPENGLSDHHALLAMQSVFFRLTCAIMRARETSFHVSSSMGEVVEWRTHSCDCLLRFGRELYSLPTSSHERARVRPLRARYSFLRSCSYPTLLFGNSNLAGFVEEICVSAFLADAILGSPCSV